MTAEREEGRREAAIDIAEARALLAVAAKRPGVAPGLQLRLLNIACLLREAANTADQ